MFEGLHNEQELFDELVSMRSNRYKEAPEETHAKIVAFARKLKKQFASEVVNDSQLYHMLIGSTTHDSKTLDVPGGLVERFIREEL